MKLDAIFLSDVVRSPLTGVGRYGFELLRGFEHDPGLATLQCLRAGRWLTPNEVLSAATPISDSGGEHRSLLRGYAAQIRSRLGASRQIARLHDQWVETRNAKVLGNVYKGSVVVHGPAFYVPESSHASVVTIHDLSVYFFPETHPATRVVRVRRMIESAIARRIRIIVDAASTRSELIDRCAANPELIDVVPLGVSPEFRIRHADEIDPVLSSLGLVRGRYLLSVSTLEPRKNIERLIQAYESLPSSLRSMFPLVLAGARGWKTTSLIASISRGLDQGWLKVLGYVSDEALPMLYAGARAFAYPSVYEGFGLPPLEAMACGVPVMCAGVSAMPEVVGDAARLVEPMLTESLREGLGDVLEKDDLRAHWIRAGLERARHFTWSRTCASTLDVYRKAIASHDG